MVCLLLDMSINVRVNLREGKVNFKEFLGLKQTLIIWTAGTKQASTKKQTYPVFTASPNPKVMQLDVKKLHFTSLNLWKKWLIVKKLSLKKPFIC